MNKNEKAIKSLRERLNVCYAAYIQTLLAQDNTTLIDEAAEIAAAKVVYEEIINGNYDPKLLERLSQFDDPLETLRDEWVKNHGFDRSVDMECLLSNLPEKARAGQTLEQDKNGGMNLCQY